MPDRKLRVLLDLSMAARGFCGIAHDARLLWRMLAAHPDVEVTGLVYHPRRFGPRHRFLSTTAPKSDRVANQAAFLWKLSEGTLCWPDVGPLRTWKKLQNIIAMATEFRVPLDPLEPDAFDDVLWRLLFSRSLPPADRHLVPRAKFLLSNLSDGLVYARALSYRRPLKLDTRGYDFLIVEGPRPFRTSPGTKQIVRYHDMIPVLHPDTMSNPLVIRWHHRAIRGCAAAHFVCDADPTRDDLLRIHPDLLGRTSTIPAAIPNAPPADALAPSIESIVDLRRSPATHGPARRRRSARGSFSLLSGLRRRIRLAAPARNTPATNDFRYIMGISTLEPRKNFLGLIQAFSALRRHPDVQKRVPDLKLLVVGSPGWKCESILAAMRTLVEQGALVHLENVAADELRTLYAHAEAFVFPSFAEGFGYPPVEAMAAGTPVIASDIPTHRWVLGDAAVYCDPYDASSTAAAIHRVVASDDSPALRAQLVARGHTRARQYALDHCAQQWLNLLDRLHGTPSRVPALEHHPLRDAA